MKKLNARQEKYCQRRAAGDSRSEAYRAAGYSPEGSRRTAEQNAYRMEQKPDTGTVIRLRIEELRSRNAETAVLNREDRLRLLSELATSDAVKPQDKIRAIDHINRMTGDYNDALKLTTESAVHLTYSERIEAIRAAMESD